MAADHAGRGSADLLRGFQNPPSSARPWTWWHWMNGNVTAEGATRDLEWMKRSGMAGIQLIVANLGTPIVVKRPLTWMSPDWKSALRSSVSTAKRLHLGFAIASSPGWSISGAPFVHPADAMKKLVWSQIDVAGGHHVHIRLPQPPRTAGPYQDVRHADAKVPDFYRDARVVAFPSSHPSPLQPVGAATNAGPIDYQILSNGRFGDWTAIPLGPGTRTASLVLDYGRPVTVRSATVGLHGTGEFGEPPATDAVLEESADGRNFRPIIKLEASKSPARTASFAPVTARFFRLALSAPASGLPPMAPGVAPPTLGPPPPSSIDLSEVVLRTEGRINHAEDKAGFAPAPDYYAIPTPAVPSDQVLPPSHVIDITDRLGPDGTLDWDPPGGRWTVIRMGYSLTGHENGPAPLAATGLEVDKLDAAAVHRYIDEYLGLHETAVGPQLIGSAGIDALLSDSIEAGSQNWTPGILAEFKRLRGYDPTPWLPALTGIVVGSPEESDRFLWDFRKTIADLIAQNHYGTVAAEAKSRHLVYYSEALEDHRPQLGDDLAMRAPADVPMGAMWWFKSGDHPRQTFVADLQGAASVAHVYGKPLVGAESFTAFGAPWAFAPRDLKSTADLEFALGVNRIILHTSPHQPFNDRAPGMSLAPFLGQYFSRTETWAEMARPWLDYLARSSFLLQQGRFAADIAFFPGEEAPLTSLYGDKPLTGIPTGYGFDFVGPDALDTQLSVARDGSIMTAGGARYRILMLGGSSEFMTLATLRKLRALVEAGATIVGRRPVGSPSLADDERTFRTFANEVFGGGITATRLGKGHVYAELAPAIAALSITPDWQVESGQPDAIRVLHRHLPAGEIWFVSNQSGRALDFRISLRASGYAPELWHADSGKMEPSSYESRDGRTIVPLSLKTDDAVFIVMQDRTSVSRREAPQPVEAVVKSVEGPWLLDFAKRQGAPKNQHLRTLLDWSRSADVNVRYYSGIGIYRSQFNLPRQPGGKLLLDLGEVREIAQVSVNERPAGTTWKAPFRLDVTKLVHQGTNTLEIKVANLWVNRLIGDAQPGARPHTFTSGPTYKADAPLRPSGLLGPVQLISQAR